MGEGRKTLKQIVSELRKNFSWNTTSMKAVANFLQKLHYEDRGELSVTQWSLNFLREQKYVCYPLRSRITSAVEILFFAHVDSLWLFKKYPHVVIIDATCKTNKYVIYVELYCYRLSLELQLYMKCCFAIGMIWR